MRLGDAIQELDGLEGERVHRSWWVARQAVAEARMDGRRACLILTNGLEVQVSREATVQLRRAGWLSGQDSG
jgi:DNA-binding LytR/AlgR family response regulator